MEITLLVTDSTREVEAFTLAHLDRLRADVAGRLGALLLTGRTE
jgi:hypothetical protein